jgi:hypothetical protein
MLQLLNLSYSIDNYLASNIDTVEITTSSFNNSIPKNYSYTVIVTFTKTKDQIPSYSYTNYFHSFLPFLKFKINSLTLIF